MVVMVVVVGMVVVVARLRVIARFRIKVRVNVSPLLSSRLRFSAFAMLSFTYLPEVVWFGLVWFGLV